MSRIDWGCVFGTAVAIAGCGLSNWSVVVGFFVAALGTVLICRAILKHKPRRTDTGGDLPI